jgi:hypothetical protein
VFHYIDKKKSGIAITLLFFIFEAAVTSSQNRGSDRRAINTFTVNNELHYFIIY